MIWNKKAKSDREAKAQASGAAVPELDAHRASCSALCCAERGDCVLVRFLLGSASESARLREMGLCEGARLQVLRHGNPLVVRVADSRLGLAHAVAERVLVVPDEARAQPVA